jgi:hypothetical protein
MVSVVLKPLYVMKEISKDEYTAINRDISRLMYDKVGDAGAEALTNQETREKWQKLAGDEVNNAVKTIIANRPAASPSTEDSASSSS